MRKLYVKISLLSVGLFFQNSIFAQCGTPVPDGSASNMFTQIRNSTNPVAADKNLNTVVFIHRNNAGNFAGNSGNLRYDISTNAGATWTVDQGLLNPITTNLARYPNVTIYNPTNNINPANAYLGYLAATIHPTTSLWNGVVSGVRQLNGGGNTENYNQPVVNPQLIPHSTVKGAPGVFWAIDALFNGTYITGFTIYKGTWNGSTDIVWANNYSVTPSFNLSYNGTQQVADYNIAFDPTGQIGWFSFLSHVSPGPSNYAYYPVLYKTTNGGATWTGPIQVDLNQFSCITGNISANNVATTNFEHDLTVDVNGNPHIFTTICNGTNAYSVFYNSWHHMFDITMNSGIWVAYDVANSNAGRGTWGVSPNQASMDMAPQVSRTSDGSKIFFTWSENSNYTAGQANLSPNLYTKAYDVIQNKWTQVKDVTSCNGNIAGKVLFPHMAPEVLEPALNTFKLATVYGEYTAPGDPLQVSNFLFLDNVTYASAEFSVIPPSATVTIQPNSPIMLCPNSTVFATVGPAAGGVLWSTGSTNTIIPISSPTISTYSVVAQVGCYLGTASVTVVNVSVSATAPLVGVCPGNTTTLTVSGNALSYTWNPGNITGTSAVVTASTIPVFTVIGSGSGNCAVSQTVGITIFSLPTISISGNTAVCVGSSITQTANGATSYLWSDGTPGPIATFTPPSSTTYTVIGTDLNSCVNTQTVSIVVNPLPTVTAISTASVICAGETVSLTASGAINYSWTGVAGTQIIASSPSVTTTYTVTGTDLNLCKNSKTIQVVVNPVPSLTIATSRTIHCVNEKSFSLTVSGAQSYTWTHNNVNSTLIAVNPSVTTTYTVIGRNSFGCVTTNTFEQLVSNCLGLPEGQAWGRDLMLFPNPNSGEFYIISSSPVHVVIVNELGQVVQNVNLDNYNNFQGSIKDLSPGIYFVKPVNDEAIRPQKVIISR